MAAPCPSFRTNRKLLPAAPFDTFRVAMLRSRNRNPCVRNGPFCCGDPGRIRTCDLQLRRLLLYPLSYGAATQSLYLRTGATASGRVASGWARKRCLRFP